MMQSRSKYDLNMFNMKWNNLLIYKHYFTKNVGRLSDYHYHRKTKHTGFPLIISENGIFFIVLWIISLKFVQISFWKNSRSLHAFSFLRCFCRLSGVSPFAGENDKETKDNVLYVRYHFDHLYKEVTPEATHFLMQLFKRTPQ